MKSTSQSHNEIVVHGATMIRSSHLLFISCPLQRLFGKSNSQSKSNPWSNIQPASQVASFIKSQVVLSNKRQGGRNKDPYQKLGRSSFTAASQLATKVQSSYLLMLRKYHHQGRRSLASQRNICGFISYVASQFAC